MPRCLQNFTCLKYECSSQWTSTLHTAKNAEYTVFPQTWLIPEQTSLFCANVPLSNYSLTHSREAYAMTFSLPRSSFWAKIAATVFCVASVKTKNSLSNLGPVNTGLLIKFCFRVSRASACFCSQRTLLVLLKQLCKAVRCFGKIRD